MSSVDLRAHLSRISAAKREAEKLRIWAAACQLANLRDESNAVVDEALELLREFEAKVRLVLLLALWCGRHRAAAALPGAVVDWLLALVVLLVAWADAAAGGRTCNLQWQTPACTCLRPLQQAKVQRPQLLQRCEVLWRWDALAWSLRVAGSTSWISFGGST
jgi:hypothetical protein